MGNRDGNSGSPRGTNWQRSNKDRSDRGEQRAQTVYQSGLNDAKPLLTLPKKAMILLGRLQEMRMRLNRSSPNESAERVGHARFPA